MAVRPAFDPPAQRKILYMYTLANTDDADLASELVPLDEKPISESTQLATLAMGALMEGLPVIQRRGLDEIDYVQTMLQLTGQVLQQIQGLEQVPQSLTIRMHKIGGAVNALEHVQQHLQLIAMDPSEKELVRQMEEEMTRQMTAVKGFAQHLDEELQASQEQQGDGGEMQKTMAKLQGMLVEAQARARMKEADHAQKLQHKDVQWSEENARRNADTQAEIGRKNLLAVTDAHNKLLQTQADIAAEDALTAAEIRRPQPTNGESE